MLFPELSIYAQIIIVLLGLLVIFPWVTIPAVAIYQFFRVMRMPKAAVVGAKVGVDVVERLGLTMADGGEPTDKKKK
jgi:hypothetical protein